MNAKEDSKKRYQLGAAINKNCQYFLWHWQLIINQFIVAVLLQHHFQI
jgi:hypothetical protein